MDVALHSMSGWLGGWNLGGSILWPFVEFFFLALPVKSIGRHWRTVWVGGWLRPVVPASNDSHDVVCERSLRWREVCGKNPFPPSPSLLPSLPPSLPPPFLPPSPFPPSLPPSHPPFLPPSLKGGAREGKRHTRSHTKYPENPFVSAEWVRRRRS